VDGDHRGPALFSRFFGYVERRRGETAAGKASRGAQSAVQVGLRSKRREAEVLNSGQFEDLRVDRDVNELPGICVGRNLAPQVKQRVFHGGETLAN
jgi:hypothetical protein